MVTLTARSCVARQEPYIPGALSILPGPVPGRIRGSGHMVPTYFRRELRDRALQRPSRLRTFLSCCRCRPFRHCRHTPRKRSIQYAAVSPFYHERSGILDHPLSRAMTAKYGDDSNIRRSMSDIPANPSKADLRAAALAKRETLSTEQRAAAAQALTSREFPVDVRRGAVVSGYWPIRNEIDPLPLLRRLAVEGAQLALPVIVGRDQPLVFRAWTRDTQLLRVQLGIMEPSPQSSSTIPDILLIPLAAFDRAGHRIGYGAAHYDRSLVQLRAMGKVTAIGLAFAVQQIAAIPSLPHDIALDYVLTESQMFDFRSL